MNISVVIPCRNEAPYIKECIDAIYNSKIESNVCLNVMVVDGMSDDGTRDIVTELIEQFPTLQLIDNTKQLTPFAFNLGIHAMEYDFIQIVGARHIISSNYIGDCLNKLKSDSSVWCVGGRIINEYINDTGRIISCAMATSFGMGIGNFRTLEKSGYTDTVTSPMYPKLVFEKIGFFDERLIRNQDDDFNFRVIKAGGKIYYDHEISLKYYVRGNFKGLWKQFFQYGYWKVYVNKKHKSVTTLRQLAPPLFVAYLAILFLSTLISIPLAGFFGIPFIIYVAMLMYFSLKASENKIPFFEVLKTYLILHISYGLGYLKGIWTFFVMKQHPSDKQKELSR